MALDLARIHIDKSRTPLYRQLADQLRALIDDGTLRPGESLPSEPRIAEGTGISRDAVRNAVQVLVDEALILRTHGSPHRVAEPPLVRVLSDARYAKELTILRAGGEHPPTSAFVDEHGIRWDEYTIDVLAISRDEATARDAELLRVEPGTPILRRRFVKRIGGEPRQIQVSAMRWDLAGETPVADPARQPWPGGTIAELYSLGLRDFNEVIDDIGARPPRGDERGLLRMPPGPVLDVVRVVGAGGEPVETSRIVLDAARYRLRFVSDLTSA